MLASSRDELICDMAETYRIYDIKALPVSLLATLASGLRENSRTVLKMNGMKEVPLFLMVAHIADDLKMFDYSFSDDAKHHRNKPKLFTDEIFSREEPKKTDGFDSGNDFDDWWQNMTKGTVK